MCKRKGVFMAGERMIVNMDTGGCDGMIHPGDKIKITRAESIEYLSQYSEWKIGHFYKGNLPELKRWMKDLSPGEKAILFTVSPYVWFTDCCLKKGDGDMLTFDDIVELSGLSRGAVSTILNSLIDKDILYRGKNSKERQYFMNPWLVCKGDRINQVLKTMFRNYRIRVLDGRKWKDVKDSELK